MKGCVRLHQLRRVFRGLLPANAPPKLAIQVHPQSAAGSGNGVTGGGSGGSSSSSSSSSNEVSSVQTDVYGTATGPQTAREK